jgi:hypothetical protein
MPVCLFACLFFSLCSPSYSSHVDPSLPVFPSYSSHVDASLPALFSSRLFGLLLCVCPLELFDLVFALSILSISWLPYPLMRVAAFRCVCPPVDTSLPALVASRLVWLVVVFALSSFSLLCFPSRYSPVDPWLPVLFATYSCVSFLFYLPAFLPTYSCGCFSFLPSRYCPPVDPWLPAAAARSSGRQAGGGRGLAALSGE